MFRYILCIMLTAYTGLAFADYEDEFVFPDYADDDAAEHCVKITQDRENCAKEESQRVLNNIKLFYKDILADKRMIQWNGSFEANKNMMRDMYESWTAFRNRACSLDAASAKYSAPLIDPKISCTLYMNFNHHDYLNQVLYTLNKNNPKNPYPAKLPHVDGGNTYLQVDHDEDYQNCIKNKNGKDNDEECLKAEIERTTKQIKDTMASLMASPVIAKWNNGTDIKNGNYRDMFDSWVAFRNRMCSLTAYAQKQTNGAKAVSFNTCIQFYNESFAKLLQNYLQASYTVYEEEMIIDEKDEEGGEEEGKSIKPLNRHIMPDVKEIPAENGNDDEKESETKDKTDSSNPTDRRGRPLPAWAR